MSKFKFIFLIAIFMGIFLVADSSAQDCNYWFAKVGKKGADLRLGHKDEKNKENVLEGIECLLKLQGEKSRGAFGGGDPFTAPAPMPHPSVEICALYYISKLFYDNYFHARIAVLRYKDLEVSRAYNSDEAVAMAFDAYRKWFEKVKEVGLDEARKQNLDPLSESEVMWY